MKNRRFIDSAVWILVTVCVGIGMGTALTASHPGPTKTLSAIEKWEIGRGFYEEESGIEKAVQKNFPGDIWSQGDDFHNREQRWARKMAKKYGVSIQEILSAVDGDVRQRESDPSLRRRGAAPCKPRPFYD